MRLVATLLSLALMAGTTFAQSEPTVPPAGPNVNRAIKDALDHARRDALLRKMAQGINDAASPEPPHPQDRLRRPHKVDQNRGQGRWLYLPDIGWVYRPHVQPQFPPVPPFPFPLPASERDHLWQQYLEWQRRQHHERQHQQPWLPIPPLPGRPGSPFLPLPHINPPNMPPGTVPVPPPPAKD